MTTTIKLIQIGNSTGAIFPKELLEKLRVERGDVLHVLETPDGVSLQAWDEQFAKRMEIAEKIMREDRDILRELAK